MKPAEFIFWLASIVGAILSIFWIYTTFTASNEIVGEMQQTSSNLVFVIQAETVVLQHEKDTTYSTEKNLSSVYQVDQTFNASENKYDFILNGKKFASTKMQAGHIECELNMTFLDTLGEDILTDTLFITIDFNANITVLRIETKGGSNANAYWQSYFNAYGFDMRVYQI